MINFIHLPVESIFLSFALGNAFYWHLNNILVKRGLSLKILKCFEVQFCKCLLIASLHIHVGRTFKLFLYFA